MCANYEPIRLSNITGLDLPQPTFEFVSEAYPQDLCPILVAGHQADLEWRQAMFGLVPDWADDLKFSRHTYNARTETVATKPSFRSAWRKNQFALIPMQSFYEPNYESGKAIRWKIERQDHQPFTVAAIWDTWSDHLDTIRSFSMLTINADKNAVMNKFHKPEDEKRSLIIIPSEYRNDWLNADHKTAQELFHEMSVNDFHGLPAPLVRKTKSKPMNNELF